MEMMSIKIEKFPGYRIDRNGNVFSERSGRFLKPIHCGSKKRANDYLCVSLANSRPDLSRKNHSFVIEKIHIIACEAFHGPRPIGAVSRHLDGNRFNNAAENLAWGSYKENKQDDFKNGAVATGFRSGKSVFKNMEQINAAKAMLNLGIPTRSIAVIFNCSVWTIRELLSGRIYGGAYE